MADNQTGGKRNCGNCRFKALGDGGWDECHRMAPTISREGSARWPCVEPDDWCGEWEFFDGSGGPMK